MTTSHVALLLGAVVSTAIVGVHFAAGGVSRPGSETPHELFARGDCDDCHADDSDVADAPPPYHDAPNWLAAHGRADVARPARCLSCHGADTCRACHAQRPASHTPGFVEPRGGDADTDRHAELASDHPSSCAICHGPLAAPVAPCTGCHLVREIRPWARDAAIALAPWGEIGAPR